MAAFGTPESWGRSIAGACPFLARQLFNIAQERGLRRIAQRDRDAVSAGARGAADAVVAFQHVGQLKIDDMRDVVDVDASRRDVGRDQNANAAVAEIA